MALTQGRPKRKKTGGKYIPYRGKRLFELGHEMLEIKMGEKKISKVRGVGGKIKLRALRLKEANVFNPDTKKFSKSEIITVKENPANPHFVRRNIITKGAVIETKLGLVRVVNRPGQEGAINAVLLSKKE